MNILSRSCRQARSALRPIVFLAGLLVLWTGTAAAESKVVVLEIDGPIGVAQSDYIASGLEHARTSGATLVLLKLDTPGGLVSSTQDIIQEILGSPVPVVTYVWPPGAHAASAGTYILMASHVAAMAPTTRIGAATPVTLSGDDTTPPRDRDRDAASDRSDSTDDEETAGDEEPAEAPGPDADIAGDDTETRDDAESRGEEPLPGSAMERKVLNDAVAHMRSLAERYGRNADWAERSVTEAVTATASEALQLNVIEFVADDQDDLLRQMHGHEVRLQSETVALNTESTTIEEFEPNWRNKFLAVISNPEIVLIIAMIGLYGLMYEGWNPGAIVPGVVGVICLLIAAYALQILPVNYAGLALIIVGLALMTAEAFAPSFGALGLGGIAAFVFGAIMMFDSGIPGFGISIWFVIGVAVIFALLLIWLVGFAMKLRQRRAVSGRESIVGGIGTALGDFNGDGKVWLEGEAWAAHSVVPIEKDQNVIVTAMDGLVLEVEPVPAGDTTMQPQT